MNDLLAQCCGSGGGTGGGSGFASSHQWLILLVFAAAWLVGRSILKRKGVSAMGKTWKISLVAVVAVGVVVAIVMASRPGSDPSSQATGLPRLVDLGSTTCLPCKLMAPILEDLKKGYAGRLQVEFIDVNVDPKPAKAFGVKLIPTQVFIDASGKELWRHEGFFSREEILAKWKELGVPFSEPAGSVASAPALTPGVKSGST